MKKLEELIEIKNEMEQVNFNKKEFTRKEFESHFRNKRLVSIKWLEDFEIVSVVKKESVKIKLPTPVKKYFINGVEIKDNFYIERLTRQMTKQDLENANIVVKSVTEIDKERFYYRYDLKSLNDLIKKYVEEEKERIERKLALLQLEKDDLERELMRIECQI